MRVKERQTNFEISPNLQMYQSQLLADRRKQYHVIVAEYTRALTV